ncbi:NAD-dependent protein deacylase sirtuin-5, mitochondrial [Parasteatoda tepidariorum]|uniref:NAD-dependent protein deacylase sirtuin-5, mitochondrial n=1 Tax=Parasteatoda tepidariorum TaxID=114398 RepID=UPI00077FCDF4|nr:NAD-dependent protein deacylase sirtuin-5, mitochondrial [Parasteatoda tepidariorum]XP_015907552.1 NAD-dependent protein deacylase sirtuin-5, mitochondrial [Parasteatoda tepidariorum]XP_015907553.1 NAD-dependent protein deacylase sirtuin-5, mitochondrial [Parasteatoda tepidariorum]XP_015907554.1 NAD-dependent protein deacylase sirtuin-5, mitochondrial [Parasteatoda tepidariorum]XP_015907555.1 NAD-dependent protein deacylase sirtuin-5, mitochondrial [Parasteatoda tepidariorum]
MAFCVLRRHSTFLRRMASSSLAGKVRKQPSSDMAAFRMVFQKAKHVVALTGAGISAESGIPTFRGAGGLWRKYNSQDLATPGAFLANPSLVWEFYNYRRDLVLSKKPNPAHFALAKAEAHLESQGRRLVVITQNIDELHRDAGTKNLLELHGTLFRTRCTKCGHISENRKNPICPSLLGKGAPDEDAIDARIPEQELPRCSKCSGLLRPHVVWFGESLDPDVLNSAQQELDQCDLCLVIGTSSVVYPAAMFAPAVADRGVPVAEFNIESTPGTENFGFHFEGFCGSTLPKALGV